MADNPRHGFVPLQAADWLAYELGLAIRQLNSGRIKKRGAFRWPMREFNRILGDAGTFAANDVKEAEQKLELVKNDPDWQKKSCFEMNEKLKM